MNFRGSTKKKKTAKRVLLVVALLLVALNVFDVLWPHTVVRSLLIPISVVRTWVIKPFVYVGSVFADKNELIAENQRLKATITELEIKELERGLQQTIAAAVVVEHDYESRGVTVPVLMRPPYTPFDTLVLDVRKHEVRAGEQVFAHGVLIGEVAQADAYTATVTLYTSPNAKTPVRVGSVDGEAVGQGGGRYTITIPKDAVIETGGVIIAVNAWNAILGVVGAVHADPSGTFQDIHASLPVAFSSLEAVTIVPAVTVVE